MKNRRRRGAVAVCIKDGVYVIGGQDENYECIMSIDKYSISSNIWEKVGDMYDTRINFCACSFMDYIYVIGGHYGNFRDDCVVFNTKDRSWKEVAVMNGAKYDAACATFEGKVVVSGGYNNGSLNTVEAYDHVADSWTYMPNMIEERFGHKSVAMKNKLFLVEGYAERPCEVFDSTCNKFVLVKSPPVPYLSEPSDIILIASKLYIFRDYLSTILIYDVENDNWSRKYCEVTDNLGGYCCSKSPQLKSSVDDNMV